MDNLGDIVGSSLLITRKPVPLRNEVVERLRSAISKQLLPQGARLIERQLCEMLGVSRTLVREALRQLEAEGLVTIIPNRGPSVAVLDRETAKGIYEVRAVLEALAGELFVKRATEEDRQRLRAAFAAGKRALERGDNAGALDEWTRFYNALHAGARNESISAALWPLTGRTHILRLRSWSMPGRREESMKELEAMLDALLGDDPTRAWESCRTHVLNAAASALKSFDQETPQPAKPTSRRARQTASLQK
jgi:GntR family transcriptional regulator, trigonelline degradation regulator